MQRGTLFTALAAIFTMSAAFVVTGATGGVDSRTSARPFRQDILKLQRAGGAAWDLYLQALQKFQQLDQGNALSWYQFNGECPLCQFPHLVRQG
jgi:hypothetical protein